jgi:hypothetical protein
MSASAQALNWPAQKEALGSVRLQGRRAETSTLSLKRFSKGHVLSSADYGTYDASKRIAKISAKSR